MCTISLLVLIITSLCRNEGEGAGEGKGDATDGRCRRRRGSEDGDDQDAWIDFIEPERVPPGHSRHNHPGLL